MGHPTASASSGNFAILAAMRRASSRVMNLAAVRRPDSVLVIDVGKRLSAGIVDDEAGQGLLTDQGGGKRRGVAIRRTFRGDLSSLTCYDEVREILEAP